MSDSTSHRPESVQIREDYNPDRIEPTMGVITGKDVSKKDSS
jgi:hypothetical protein